MKLWRWFSIFVLCSAAQAQNLDPQDIPSYKDSVKKTTWFKMPDDINFRVAWVESEQEHPYQWCDVQQGTLGHITSWGYNTEIMGSPDFEIGPVFEEWKFSPDGARLLLFYRDVMSFFDNKWRMDMLDLKNLQQTSITDDTWSSDAAWSHDSKKIAYIKGTNASVGNRSIEEDPTCACVYDLTKQREIGLRSDLFFNGPLVWSAHDDLLVSTRHYRREAVLKPHYHPAENTPVVVRYSGGKKVSMLWRENATIPSPSPDGRWCLFWSPTQYGEQLELARADGTQGRRLDPEPESSYRYYSHSPIFWAPVSTSFWAWRYLPANHPNNLKTNSPDESDEKLGLYLCRFNINTRKLTPLLSLTPTIEDSDLIFCPLGTDKKGGYLFFKTLERGKDKQDFASLYAVRLSDGKLTPIGAFRGDVALAPL